MYSNMFTTFLSTVTTVGSCPSVNCLSLQSGYYSIGSYRVLFSTISHSMDTLCRGYSLSTRTPLLRKFFPLYFSVVISRQSVNCIQGKVILRPPTLLPYDKSLICSKDFISSIPSSTLSFPLGTIYAETSSGSIHSPKCKQYGGGLISTVSGLTCPYKNSFLAYASTLSSFGFPNSTGFTIILPSTEVATSHLI